MAGHILRNLGLDGGHQVILFPDTSVHAHLKSTSISWGPNIDPTSQVSFGLRGSMVGSVSAAHPLREVRCQAVVGHRTNPQTNNHNLL